MTLDDSLRTGSISYLKDKAKILLDGLWHPHYSGVDQSQVWGIWNEELSEFKNVYDSTIDDLRLIVKNLDDIVLKKYCLDILDEFPGLDLNQFLDTSFDSFSYKNIVRIIVFPLGIYNGIQKTRQFSNLLSEIIMLADKLTIALVTPNYSTLIAVSSLWKE